MLILEAMNKTNVIYVILLLEYTIEKI